jgi:hypothetical protein
LHALGIETRQIWNLPFEPVVCCDKKSVAHEFADKFVDRKKIAHWFTDCAESLANSGFCAHHNTTCKVPSQEYDMLVFGSPCSPFTDFRGNMKLVSPWQHPLFNLTFGEGDDDGSALRHILDLQPATLIGDQVSGFNRMDIRSGRTYLAQFVSMVRSSKNDNDESNYNVRVVQLKASDWAADLERERFHEQSW